MTGAPSREELLMEAAALDALEKEPLGPREELLLDERYVVARACFEAVLHELGLAPPPVEPPPELKARLFERLAEPEAGRIAGSFEVVPGVTAVRTAGIPWLSAPLPGVTYKAIARDEERGTETRLVRFAPGTRYPKHRHGGTEEIFVLEGTVWVNGTLLKAGDYCRSLEGTEEEGTFTEEGATAIVTSSDRDEISP